MRLSGDSLGLLETSSIAAGVRAGDTLSHVSRRGTVTRCRVARVVDAHEVEVVSAYRRKKLVLPDATGQHIKVFDQDSYALRLSRMVTHASTRRDARVAAAPRVKACGRNRSGGNQGPPSEKDGDGEASCPTRRNTRKRMSHHGGLSDAQEGLGGGLLVGCNRDRSDDG